LSAVPPENNVAPLAGPKFALIARHESASGTAKVVGKTLTNGAVTLLLNAFGKGYECGIVTPI
jgi:hypothetical protein